MGSSAIKCYCLFKLFALLTAAGDGEDNGDTIGYITIDSSPDAMQIYLNEYFALRLCWPL